MSEPTAPEDVPVLKPIELTKNIDVEMVVDLIRDGRITQSVADSLIIKILKSPNMRGALSRRRLSERDLVGLLAEAYLNDEISALTGSYPGLITPLERLVATGEEVYFRRDPESGRIIVVGFDHNDDRVEYDDLVKISGLWTVFESKLACNDSPEVFNDRQRSAMGPASVERMFRPLQDVYGDSSFGYVVVVNHETAFQGSGTAQNFQNRGGIILPHPVPTADLFDLAREITTAGKDLRHYPAPRWSRRR